MKIKELTNQEFDTFTSHYKEKSLFQTPEYGFVMNSQNYDSLFLGMTTDEGEIVAATLVLIERLKGFKYAYAPRGFLIDYQNKEMLRAFTVLIKKYLGKKDVIAVKISPLIIKTIHDIKAKQKVENKNYDEIFQNLKSLGYFHHGYNFYFEAMKPRYEAILDLQMQPEVLFQNFDKRIRTKIRSAVKNGIQIYRGSKVNLKYLYLHTKKKYPRDLKYYEACYEFFNKRKKIDFYYAKLDTQVYLKLVQKNYEEAEKKAIDIEQLVVQNSGKNTQKIINKKIKIDNDYDLAKKNLITATKLLREFPDGLPLASALVVKNQKEVYLLIDGFHTNYKSFNAKHLLLWKIIEKYSNEGFESFNLGGVSNPELVQNEFKGLNDFKLGFNPKVYEYIGDLELITNSALYFLYRNSPKKGIFKR